jgi:transposase InsO family protein
MGRLGRLGLQPAERYERRRPGELIHIDVKKLGRIQGGAGKRITGIKRNPHKTRRDKIAGFDRSIIGWEYVHIAIDDATRPGPRRSAPDEKATTAIGFLTRAVRHHASRERTAALTGWLDFYNRRRPHGALSHKPPIARLHERNNPLGSYT